MPAIASMLASTSLEKRRCWSVAAAMASRPWPTSVTEPLVACRMSETEETAVWLLSRCARPASIPPDGYRLGAQAGGDGVDLAG
jgi:hypothetical protein